MVHVPVSWSSGQTITEVKKDQEMANADHIREETNYFPLLTIADCPRGAVVGGFTLRLRIDSTDIGVGVASGSERRESDINISAFSTGLHTLRVAMGATTRTFRFYKTADMTYLTYWAHIASEVISPDTYYWVASLTVIATREEKSWT